MDRVRHPRSGAAVAVTTPILPRAGSQLVDDRTGLTSREWYSFFSALRQAVGDNSSAGAVIDQILQRLTALENAAGNEASIIGPTSVLVLGSLAGGLVQIILQGDTDLPGNTTAYGTDGAGAKGWFPIADALAGATGEVSKAVGGDGVTTLGLENVPDAGGGTLQRTQFDTKGRKTGTSAADTDDLAEGATNLYFTPERAQDAVGAMVDDSADVTLVYDDAVPSLTANLTNTAVAAGSYGSGSQIATFTVDGKGRLTAAGQTAVSSAAVTHNSTTGLQGGTAGEYNHLTNDELGKLNELVAPRGHIDGLGLQWDSATGITVRTGSAYIEGAAKVVEVLSDLVESGLSLTASAWTHVYLYLNAGVPDLELSTTAPAAPYSGTARSKTGDTSRRYLGSLRTDGSSNIYNFKLSGNQILYRENLSLVPFRVLSAGAAIVETTVSAAAVVPLVSGSALLRLINVATTGNLYSGTSDDSAAGPPNGGLVGLTPGGNGFVNHPLNTSQAFTYWFDATPTGAGAYCDVYGYTLER